MIVYWNDRYLHLGRAMPREWLRPGREVSLTKTATYYGPVDVRYRSDERSGCIEMLADLRLRRPPASLLARFRHPEGKPITSVELNGEPWSKFDPTKNDVDLTGTSGTVVLRAHF